MKRKTVMVFALSLLASAVFAAEGSEAVRNGKFTETGAPPKNAKGVVGTQWAKNWNCAGAAELKEGKIHLSSGVIYQLLSLPGDGRQYLVDLSLTRENPSAAENFGSSNPVQLRS